MMAPSVLNKKTKPLSKGKKHKTNKQINEQTCHNQYLFFWPHEVTENSDETKIWNVMIFAKQIQRAIAKFLDQSPLNCSNIILII